MKTKLVVLLACLIASVGCVEHELLENETSVAKNGGSSKTVITNVVRVFLHQPNQHYSALSAGKDALVQHDLRVSSVKIIPDVPPNETMWVYCTRTWNHLNSAEIHVWGPEVIHGGPWTNITEKSTSSGMTVVIR